MEKEMKLLQNEENVRKKPKESSRKRKVKINATASVERENLSPTRGKENEEPSTKKNRKGKKRRKVDIKCSECEGLYRKQIAEEWIKCAACCDLFHKRCTYLNQLEMGVFDESEWLCALCE